MNLYPFKVFQNDLLRSEHMTRKDAEKNASRLLAMSRGRLTATDFEIVDLTVSAVLAARKMARLRRRAATPQQLGLI
jgi:hypothetical protein